MVAFWTLIVLATGLIVTGLLRSAKADVRRWSGNGKPVVRGPARPMELVSLSSRESGRRRRRVTSVSTSHRLITVSILLLAALGFSGCVVTPGYAPPAPAYVVPAPYPAYVSPFWAPWGWSWGWNRGGWHGSDGWHGRDGRSGGGRGGEGGRGRGRR